MRVAAVALLVACSSSPPPKPPAAPPPKCAKVADHFIELMTPTAQDAPADQLDGMRKLFNDHCRDDRWSDAAQDCVLAAQSHREIAEKCGAMLTAEQTKALGMAIESQQSPPPPTSDAGVDDAKI